MVVTNYIWDGDSVLAETDEAGAVTTAYNRHPDGSLMSQTRAGQTNFHHYDALGSTSELTNDDGDVTNTFRSSAFGEEVKPTGTTPTPYKWIGRTGYQSDDSERIYIRRRHYQPSNQRWMSSDPAGFPEGPNTFMYAQNSPLDRTDPSGLASQFSDVVLRGVPHDTDPTRLATLFSVVFTPDPDDLTLEPSKCCNGQCCCCTEIGFVQRVHRTQRFGWVPVAHHQIIFPDGGVPISYGSVGPPMQKTPVAPATGNPCKGERIGTNDFPSVRSSNVFGPLKKATFEAQTCVICLDGEHAKPFNVYTPCTGNDMLCNNKIYSCLSWSWTVERQPNGSYCISRGLGGVTRPASGCVSHAVDKTAAGTASFSGVAATSESAHGGIIGGLSWCPSGGP